MVLHCFVVDNFDLTRIIVIFFYQYYFGIFEQFLAFSNNLRFITNDILTKIINFPGAVVVGLTVVVLRKAPLEISAAQRRKRVGGS